ncbi:F-box domain-containing protein/PP2 domain-containing protein [Cephalotus follicularis]|uniref:F-box domain-containing protein/PP2 domain-containing protein n=1 Tax=Cephalotus follicularis TaxID=3775 RepID=A0A1Q3CHC8_CEPFO|nr:F-box domain-containing protein/PP2 domain-containing protein [Cephalotus follicularis]
MEGLCELPEGCIAHVLSLTGPRDACRSSLVSSTFKSAAESDVVWESFLPPEYKSIIATSASPSALPFTSKKDLFLSLCHNPILIDDGNKSFSLDKWSGKKCYMISARDLMIVWGNTPTYWRWISLPEARFAEVAELKSVCWLEVRGRINTRMLSPTTLYAAYLVFKAATTTRPYGFEFQPVEAEIGLIGSESCKRTVYLDIERGQRQQYQIVPRHVGRVGHFTWNRMLGLQASVPAERNLQYPKDRGDKWFEIELGDFYNEGGDQGELEISVLEVVGGYWKGGIIIQGIDIRPKVG